MTAVSLYYSYNVHARLIWNGYVLPGIFVTMFNASPQCRSNAMPRYMFYSCTQSGSIVELGSKQLMGLEDARAEGKCQIRKLMADAVSHGRDISRRKLEIRNATHQLLASMQFKEAVTRE